MAEATLKENDQAFDAFSFLARFAPLIFLLLLMAIFAIMEPRFLSSINLFNVMRQVSITGLLAIGMTFVILTAGIDLSVGSLLAFAGLVAAAVAKGGMQDRFTVGDAAIGYGWPLAALSAILVGLACGYLQGIAITKLKVPAFRRDAWRHVGVPRRCAFVCGRRAHLRLPARIHLVGPGPHLHRAGAGHHLSGVGRAGPYRAALHALWPEGLCGGRQS